jgi:hypothetical protein
MPWPHLAEPSYYPDPNVLFDPARARDVYAEHLDQMAMYEDYGFDAVCMNEHHDELDFDLTQKEALTLVGDPDYAAFPTRSPGRTSRCSPGLCCRSSGAAERRRPAGFSVLLLQLSP